MLLVFQEDVLIVSYCWNCMRMLVHESWEGSLKKRRFQRIEELEMESDGISSHHSNLLSFDFFVYFTAKMLLLRKPVWSIMTTMCIESRSGKKKTWPYFQHEFFCYHLPCGGKTRRFANMKKSPSRQLVAMLSAWLQTSTPSGGGKIWVTTFHAGWFWCTMLSKTEPLLFGADRGNWV